MNHTDIKLALLNATTFFIAFSNFENILKVIALLTSIGYTGLKFYDYIKKRKNGSNNTSED